MSLKDIVRGKHCDKYIVELGRICDRPATNSSGPCGVVMRCDEHHPLALHKRIKR